MTAPQTRRSPAATGLRDRTHNTTAENHTADPFGRLLVSADTGAADPVALGQLLEEVGSRMVKLGARTQLIGDLMPGQIATELDAIATGTFQLSVRIRALARAGKVG